MDDRLLILLDWDGVVNVEASARQRRHMCFHHGWRDRRIEALWTRAFYNPAVGPWLLRLALETGAELAWGSKWEDYASTWFGPLIGLHGLLVSPANATPTKAHGIVPWTAGRPFVWFEDEADEAAATDELAGDQPHLVILTDEFTGLTEAHIEQAREWLLALNRST
jgi:hypothetical protein